MATYAITGIVEADNVEKAWNLLAYLPYNDGEGESDAARKHGVKSFTILKFEEEVVLDLREQTD